MMSGENDIRMTCTCCHRTQTYVPQAAVCFECTIKKLAKKFGYIENKRTRRLRDLREMAYLAVITGVPLYMVGHYFNHRIQMLALGFLCLGQMVDSWCRWLARKF